MEIKTVFTLPAKRLHNRRSRGFTLIELLVVLAILALLAGVVGPKVMQQWEKARVDTARLQIGELQKSLDTYKLDVGRYPAGEHGLEALVRNPGNANNWNGPYLAKEKALIDPWGNPYQYSVQGSNVEIISLGADGSPGGDGFDADISSHD